MGGKKGSKTIFQSRYDAQQIHRSPAGRSDLAEHRGRRRQWWSKAPTPASGAVGRPPSGHVLSPALFLGRLPRKSPLSLYIRMILFVSEDSGGGGSQPNKESY
jgi:hypothetical protein